MGIQDRDWYRESYREREAKYGSDFKLDRCSSREEQKNGSAEVALYAIAFSFFGAVLALVILVYLNFIWPVFIMLFYNLWMIVYIFSKKPKTGIGTRVLAVAFFLISIGLLWLILYLQFVKNA